MPARTPTRTTFRKKPEPRPPCAEGPISRRVQYGVRSCVVTRERRPPAALIRLAIDDDGVLQLAGSGQSGRGAWIVPEAFAFLQLVERPQVLRRSLKTVPRRMGPLLEDARAAEDASVANLLVQCWRAGLLRVPDQSSREAGWILTPRSPGCRVEVPSRAPQGRRKGRRPQGRWTPPPLPSPGQTLSVPFTSPQLAVILSRSTVNTLQLAPGRPARRLLQGLQRRQGLGYGASPSASASDLERSPPTAPLAERAPLSGQTS